MEPYKFTAIAHSNHVFCSPLSESKLERILELIELSPKEKVIDVGCGKAELLIRLIEKFQVNGIGIDPNPYFLGEARNKAIRHLQSEKLVLHETAVAEFPIESDSFALVQHGVNSAPIKQLIPYPCKST